MQITTVSGWVKIQKPFILSVFERSKFKNVKVQNPRYDVTQNFDRLFKEKHCGQPPMNFEVQKLNYCSKPDQTAGRSKAR